VLEVGAGHGTFTEPLAALGAVTAVEPDPWGSQVLRDRYGTDDGVRVVAGTLDDVPPVGYGSAVMINVLEHIDDDEGALATLRELVVPGGCVVIWVPAYPLLYSPFDRKLGHFRRYRTRDLTAVVRRAGLDVAEHRHVNLPGWFSWLLLVRLLRREPTSPRLVAIFDRWVVPVVRWVEARVRVPFGQSILLVARVPAR
jgi:SAM-dependent methyltransferase